MSLRERLQKVKEEVRDEPRTNPGSAGVSHPTGRINVRPRVLEPQGKPEARQSSATKEQRADQPIRLLKSLLNPYLEVKAKIHSRLVKGNRCRTLRAGFISRGQGKAGRKRLRRCLLCPQ